MDPQTKKLLETLGLLSLPTPEQIMEMKERLAKLQLPPNNQQVMRIKDDLETLDQEWPTGELEGDKNIQDKLDEILEVKWGSATRLALNQELLYPISNRPISPEALSIGNQIIEKYVEAGVFSFEEILREVCNCFGAEMLERYFEGLKVGYINLLLIKANPDDFDNYWVVNSYKVEELIKKCIKPSVDLHDIYAALLLNGSNPDLKEIFNRLPTKVQNGIKDSIPLILRRGNAFLNDVQDAMAALDNFQNSGMESFDAWSCTHDMFNDDLAPKEVFSRMSLAIAGKLNASAQLEIKQMFCDFDGR